MKKTIIFLSALLALVACTNLENPQKDGVIDASKVVFNINVEKINDPATKGVKTAWENGDVVYVFFEDNTTQYVKMTRNADGSWTYRDKDGGTDYTGLELTATGKKLSAVYMPGFVIGTAAPSYVTDKWTIGKGLGGYILTTKVAVPYTVTVGDVTTLDAVISLEAPANMMQVYIPSTDAGTPASGNEFVLNMTNVKPFTFDGIAPGGAATITAGNVNFPLAAYNGALGTETGYYFWGILANASAGAIDYNFQLVEQNAEKKYAISSKSKTVTGKNLTGPTAIKLSGLTDNGKFVSMGYAGGPLWATGNLDKTNGIIVAPLEAGEYFMYGYKSKSKDPYTDPYTGMENPLPTDYDAAYQANKAWRIPTRDQFDALINYANTKGEWKSGWTSFGQDNGGYLITSKSNGISLFFAAAGRYIKGTLHFAGDQGFCWSSTPFDSDDAYYLFFIDGSVGTINGSRDIGLPVRPVQKVQN